MNLAAKLQGLAEAGQIAFSEPIVQDRETRHYFSQNKGPLARLQFTQPWNDQKLAVYRFNVHLVST